MGGGRSTPPCLPLQRGGFYFPMNKKYIALAMVLMIALAACSSRLPKPSRSQKIIQSYFKKYAKKYPTTPFGQYGVTKVEVDNTTEIRKKYAAVEAYITLGDGNLKKIGATIEKKPFGWKLLSWEDETL